MALDAEATHQAAGDQGADRGERLGVDPATGRPLRVCLVNQYLVPDVASTGYLIYELAIELAKLGFDVKVYTTMPGYGPKETRVVAPRREVVEGVEIHRLWATRFSKTSLVGRASNYLTFVASMFLRLLFTSRRDTVYLYTTAPPILTFIGAMVSLFRKHRYVHLLYDAFPQVAVWVGTIRGGSAIDRLWHAMNKICYGRATRAIVLCQKARSLVHDTYGMRRDRIHVIPNWADGEEFQRREKADSKFAREHDLLDKFVVMYSGNLGLYYDFETILGAAERLEGEPFKLVLIGSGGKREWIREQIEARKLKNTLLLPYQPRASLNDSLSAADASLVSIAEGIEGISFPSKLYTSLAVGRTILALSETDSELRELVEKRGVGRWAALGDVDGMAEVIRGLMHEPGEVREQGLRARELFERGFTREICSERYARVLRAAHPLVDSDAELHLDSIGG